MTVRDTRRPKERQRDKDYRRLTLTSSNGFPIARVIPVPSGVPLRIAAAAPASNLSLFSVASPALGRGASPQNDPVYDIFLIYNGQDVRHQVYESMPILQLVREAGARFRLDWTDYLDAFLDDSSYFGPEWLNLRSSSGRRECESFCFCHQR